MDYPKEGWEGRIWQSWTRLYGLENEIPVGITGEIIAIIDTPWIISRAFDTGNDPVLVHGLRVGAVLGEALKTAGRDVTRRSLLSALENTILTRWGLNYRLHRLTGSDDIDFITVTGRK